MFGMLNEFFPPAAAREVLKEVPNEVLNKVLNKVLKPNKEVSKIYGELLPPSEGDSTFGQNVWISPRSFSPGR